MLKNVKPGSIILFHNAAEHTPEALPGILEALQKDGYNIVPISKLVLSGDYTIDSTGCQCPLTSVAPSASPAASPVASPAASPKSKSPAVSPAASPTASPKASKRPAVSPAASPATSPKVSKCPIVSPAPKT